MKTRKGWKQLGAGQPAFYNKTLRVSVYRSLVNHCWQVTRDGRGTQCGEYATEQAAMIAAEKRG